MNNIIQPVTSDGLVGFDEFGQLCAWEQDGEFRRGWHLHDVRQKTCIICGRKWDLTSESLKDQVFLQEKEAWVHQSCHKRYLALSEFYFWYGAVCGARIRYHGLEEIPNEYRGGWNLPWYRAKLCDRHASLKLGTRKHVYHMEIELSGDPRYDREKAKAFLEREDVTKKEGVGGLYLHAHSKEKAKEYLKAFAEILGLPDPGK